MRFREPEIRNSDRIHGPVIKGRERFIEFRFPYVRSTSPSRSSLPLSPASACPLGVGLRQGTDQSQHPAWCRTGNRPQKRIRVARHECESSDIYSSLRRLLPPLAPNLPLKLQLVLALQI